MFWVRNPATTGPRRIRLIALEAEFEAPLELLLFRARSIKNLLSHCGDYGTYRSKPLPGEMKRYLQKIKKTNGEIRWAVKEEAE